MNADGQMIGTLAESEVFRTYSRAFNETTGLPLALRPVECWNLPLHRRTNEAPWCALMAGTSRTCAACLRTQAEIAGSATDRPATVTCAFGLSETAVPVRLGAKTIGHLQTGQVMLRKPTAASFRGAMNEVEKLGLCIDAKEAEEAYFATPVVGEKRLDAVASLLSIFAEHLSETSNRIAVRSANAEPPMIGKARRYIDEHHTEDLSLGRVARAMHMSLFYFCKLFRKSTGVTFTEYVARVRSEKAKNLLLNRNLRVSEIAYAVGFQSLTHFNRVFRKVVGESPTSYRNRLPGAV